MLKEQGIQYLVKAKQVEGPSSSFIKTILHLTVGGTLMLITGEGRNESSEDESHLCKEGKETGFLK